MTRGTHTLFRVTILILMIVVTPLLVTTAASLLGLRPPQWLVFGSVGAVVPLYGLVEATRQLREEMRQHRLMFPQCFKCGYNLTGNQTGACPECGEPFR